MDPLSVSREIRDQPWGDNWVGDNNEEWMMACGIIIMVAGVYTEIAKFRNL